VVVVDLLREFRGFFGGVVHGGLELEKFGFQRSVVCYGDLDVLSSSGFVVLLHCRRVGCSGCPFALSDGLLETLHMHCLIMGPGFFGPVFGEQVEISTLVVCAELFESQFGEDDVWLGELRRRGFAWWFVVGWKEG
jgi:hypothetical protein